MCNDDVRSLRLVLGLKPRHSSSGIGSERGCSIWWRVFLRDDFDGILSGDQIRTLIGIAEHRSFQGAAIALGVQQPAVNQLVKRLEGKVGRQLFDRSSRGVTMTSDGEAVLIYARAMAKLGTDLSRHFGREMSETVLRIGMGEEFSRTSLPAVLAVFSRLHQNLRFQAVCVIPSADLFQRLDEGVLDVVVARQDPHRSAGEPVWTEPTVWTARKDFTLSAEDPIPLVLPTAGVLRDMMLTSLSTGSRGWRCAFEGGSLAMMEAAIRAGLGISACTARMELADATPLNGVAQLPELPPSTFVLERARPARSEVVAAFCDLLRTSASLSFGFDLQDSAAKSLRHGSRAAD